MRLVTLFSFLLLLAASATAEENAPETEVYEQPALLTSIGQAADVLIMKGLCARAGLKVTEQKLATPDSLDGFKSLILVAGGSSKGLGAAKIDVSDEEERGKKLIKAAKKADIPVLTFHIGGEARRGALSDPFNKLAGEGAEVILVSADGDTDNLFKEIAEENEARYIHVDGYIDVVGALKELYGLEE